MKSRILLIGILLMVFVASLFSGCGLVTPGEPTAKVTITSVSGYWWQTKGTGVELLGRWSSTCTVTITGDANTVNCPGEPGTPGATGQTGATGSTGANGIDGANGANGVDGIDGQDSINGSDGVNGINGVDGQNGVNGANGQDGQDLTLPESIYVYYTITNTGNVNIQEYTITFEAETDGGVYTGIATGTDLAVGVSLYSYVKIDVFSNEVVFVDYSLEVK